MHPVNRNITMLSLQNLTLSFTKNEIKLDEVITHKERPCNRSTAVLELEINFNNCPFNIYAIEKKERRKEK